MSYASVAASNTPEPQPRPDPALLTTESSIPTVIDDNAKVKVVPNPQHYTNDGGHGRPTTRSEQSSWDVTKRYLFRPGVAGGLIGLANVGLFFGAARAFYTQPELRRNPRVISATVGGALALLGIEGYAAEQYSKTPRGREEARRAKQEGTFIYNVLSEQLLRPGVLGGLVGAVNAAVLGTVGYYSYIFWDRPTWDRRVVSAVSVGLLALWSGEGFIAESYRQKRKY